MKIFHFSTLLALCALCFATSEAIKFSPASFLPKTKLNNKNVGATSISLADQPTAVIGGAKDTGVSGPSEGELAQVNFSYYLDIFSAVAMSAFAFFWIKSIDASKDTPPTFPYFAESVLDIGFCNKNFGKEGTELLTQKICGIVDFIMVGGSYLLAKSKGVDKNPMFIGSAIYTIIHGLVHYSVFLGIDSRGPVDPLSLAILAIILVFCPVSLYSVLNTAPKTKDSGMAIPVSAIAWALSVYAYGAIFKMKQYALTYINVVIFLLMFVSRALLIGKSTDEDIAARMELNADFGNFWLGQLSTVAVIVALCSEPFFCNSWFGEAGGHLLFDMSLYFYLLSTSVLG